MHIPVLAREVMMFLHIQPGMTAIDGTCGLGGHTALMAEAVGAQGKIVALDADDRNLALAREHLAAYGDRVRLVHDSYVHMDTYATSADAVLLDLGYSSPHVDEPARGFSFHHDGPLDMRYNTHEGITAEIIINSWSRDDLAALFRKYGEEPRAHQAAKAIFDERKKVRITRTVQLAEVLARVIPRQGKIHPATRIFQALRIAVNDELTSVEVGIAAAIRVLVPGGRLAVISFHSLEDRIVKQAFLASHEGVVITKKPIIAARDEQRQNPRSRSAKLRILEKKDV